MQFSMNHNEIWRQWIFLFGHLRPLHILHTRLGWLLILWNSFTTCALVPLYFSSKFRTFPYSFSLPCIFSAHINAECTVCIAHLLNLDSPTVYVCPQQSQISCVPTTHTFESGAVLWVNYLLINCWLSNHQYFTYFVHIRIPRILLELRLKFKRLKNCIS